MESCVSCPMLGEGVVVVGGRLGGVMEFTVLFPLPFLLALKGFPGGLKADCIGLKSVSGLVLELFEESSTCRYMWWDPRPSFTLISEKLTELS